MGRDVLFVDTGLQKNFGPLFGLFSQWYTQLHTLKVGMEYSYTVCNIYTIKWSLSVYEVLCSTSFLLSSLLSYTPHRIKSFAFQKLRLKSPFLSLLRGRKYWSISYFLMHLQWKLWVMETSLISTTKTVRFPILSSASSTKGLCVFKKMYISLWLLLVDIVSFITSMSVKSSLDDWF